ncbi:hypothetical protein FDZ71_02255, partial [bacterium]
DVQITVPLSLTTLPVDMVITSRVPSSVNVRLTGPRTIIASLSPKQFGISLDVKGIQEGTSSYEILHSRLGLPRGVEVTEISPSVVTLAADKTAYKSLPIKPRIKGAPKVGFEVEAVESNPSEITVAASDRALKVFRELETEVIDIGGIDGGLTREVQLVFPDASFKRIEQKPVKVTVKIKKMAAERELASVTVHPPAGGWLLEPATADIRVTGPVSVLSRLSAADFALSAAAPAQEGGLSKLSVTLPDEVELLSVTPEEVRVFKGK